MKTIEEENIGFTILGWILGIIFIGTGLSKFSVNFLSGLFYILAGLSVFPPFWKFILSKRKIKITRVYKAGMFIVLLIIAGLMSGGSATSSSTTQTQTVASNDTPSVAPTDEPTVTPKPTLTAQQVIANFEKQGQEVSVADIYKSPNSYKQKALIFTCTVSGFPKDDNGDVGALNCTDPNDFTSNVQVGIGKETDVTKINQGDTIKVYGFGMGAIQGQNAFGGDITTGAVVGLYINDITTGYKDY